MFATVLRKSRKGLNVGLWGSRYEYFKLCLEDETALDSLCDVANLLAKAIVPQAIVDVLRIFPIAALKKDEDRVRGIAAGDTIRRLVAKTLAKQYQQILRQAALLHNFGLADRSGTDAAIHLLRYLIDEPREYYS